MIVTSKIVKYSFEKWLDPYTIEMKHVKIIDRLRIRSVRLVSWRPRNGCKPNKITAVGVSTRLTSVSDCSNEMT